jgi:hypothetical protein
MRKSADSYKQASIEGREGAGGFVRQLPKTSSK